MGKYFHVAIGNDMVSKGAGSYAVPAPSGFWRGRIAVAAETRGVVEDGGKGEVFIVQGPVPVTILRVGVSGKRLGQGELAYGR